MNVCLRQTNKKNKKVCVTSHTVECFMITRNMHAHLCLAPVCRLRTHVINAGAGEVRVARVTFVNLL